jgi:hypothetical protein
LGRVIQEHIKKPLAEELLFGKLAKGGVVKVGVKDGKIDLRVEKNRRSAFRGFPRCTPTPYPSHRPSFEGHWRKEAAAAPSD